MSKLVTNANAPVVDINVRVDFRVQPEDISMKCSRAMPATVVSKILLKCVETLQDMLMQVEAKAALNVTGPEKPPDLPPPPAVS